MNSRARLTRRILRDHRRKPDRYSHTRWQGGFDLPWCCPRCTGLISDPLGFQLQRPLISGQWRLKTVIDRPSPGMYYDRDGRAIGSTEAERLLGDQGYRRVALTRIFAASDPGVKWDVSTIWIGVNYQVDEGDPLVFETMVFGNDQGWADQLCQRYSTEDQAKAGHAEIVALVAATVPDEVIVEEQG